MIPSRHIVITVPCERCGLDIYYNSDSRDFRYPLPLHVICHTCWERARKARNLQCQNCGEETTGNLYKRCILCREENKKREVIFEAKCRMAHDLLGSHCFLGLFIKLALKHSELSRRSLVSSNPDYHCHIAQIAAREITNEMLVEYLEKGTTEDAPATSAVTSAVDFLMDFTTTSFIPDLSMPHSILVNEVFEFIREIGMGKDSETIMREPQYVMFGGAILGKQGYYYHLPSVNPRRKPSAPTVAELIEDLQRRQRGF